MTRAMTRAWGGRSSIGASILLLLICAAGCGGPYNNWLVRTNGTPVSASFDQARLEEKSVAIFPALAMPALRGTEVGMSLFLAEILEKLTPHWKVVDEQATLTVINKQGLGTTYTQMRRDAEDAHLLDLKSLRQIGTALGVRYIFQPRLAYFSQTMTERWKVPALDLRVVQTRSGLMRISLQLWDAETGELIWTAMAEAELASEGVSQDPVFFEDAARVALGSLVSDFLNRQTSSEYTPLNQAINQLMRVSSSGGQKNDDGRKGDKGK